MGTSILVGVLGIAMAALATTDLVLILRRAGRSETMVPPRRRRVISALVWFVLAIASAFIVIGIITAWAPGWTFGL